MTLFGNQEQEMSSESELFESQSLELCKIIDLMSAQLAPSGNSCIMHKRERERVILFCQGISVKQWIKSYEHAR